MMFRLKFISVVTALFLTVGFIYVTDEEHALLFDSLFLNLLKPPKTKTPQFDEKKIVSKKPPPGRDLMIRAGKDYTFFDTLSDTTMEKQIGLERKFSISTGLGRTDFPSKKIEKSTEGRSLAVSIENLADDNLEFPDSKGKRNGYYSVQAASFKRFDRSSELVRKLKEKGFEAFIKRHNFNDGQATRYRVYLGRFEDKAQAKKVQEKGRHSFNLKPIIVYQK